MKWSEQMRELKSIDEYFKKCEIIFSDDNRKAYLYIDGKVVSESEISTDYASGASSSFRINFRFNDTVIIDPVFLYNVMMLCFVDGIYWFIKPYGVSPMNDGSLIKFKPDDSKTYIISIGLI